MTTTDVKVLHSRAAAQERAIQGMQAPLIVTEVPAGAEAMIGKPLLAQTLTVDGAYVCLIPIAGLASSVTVKVKPHLTTATLSSSGPDLSPTRSTHVTARPAHRFARAFAR